MVNKIGVVSMAGIEFSSKLMNLRLPLKAIFILIIVLILFSFPIYMSNFPVFQNAVMGNQSLPGAIKIFIVSSPSIIYFCLMIILLLYLINSLFTDILERRKKFAKEPEKKN